MSEMSAQEPDEATLDLLIKQATEGLSPAEQRALDLLDGTVASSYARAFERAVAATVLAGSVNAPAPPAALSARLQQQGEAFFASKVVDLTSVRPAPRAASRSGAYGWFAAAACLVLAVFGWLRSPPPPPPLAPAQVNVSTPPPVVAPPVVKQPTPAQARDALLAKSDSVKLNFGATKDPVAKGVSGDVVWDPVTQQGFLRFVGLPKNDPQLHQYQLWIFDASGDKRYPVDGGVFDVPADATEVLVPIHAAINVRTAAAFAVTVERPGGVVVSGREHVVALAAQPG
jgi:hypothetical protein